MSHVVPIKLEIKDLKALETACKKLGFEFIKNQKTYAWYGKFMGDFALAEGMDVNDLGKCEHAIGVPGASYEVGVKKDGKNFKLEYDFYGSNNLENKIGRDGLPIKIAYTIEATKNVVKKNRHRLVSQKRLDDRTRLTIRL